MRVWDWLSRRRTYGGTGEPPPRSPKHVLPPEAFELAAELYPLFIWELERAALDGPTFFVLSFLRRAPGRYPAPNGRPARLHTELTKTLAKISGRDQGDAANFIERLHRNGLVFKTAPQDDPRGALAQEPAGMHRMVVVLTEAGERTLDLFNGYVNDCVDELIAAVPSVKESTIGFLSKRLQVHAAALRDTARRLAERRSSSGPRNDSTVDHREGEAMWVFGYGSLMWDGWERQYGATRSARAVLAGFQRDFNKASKENWGSQKEPGPTLGLSPRDAAKCEGVAFEVPDAARHHVLEYLKEREGKSFKLEEKDVHLHSGEWVRALVPVNDVSKNTYIGDRPLAERARMAKVARGSSGSCVDYVKSIRGKLQELGIEDWAVEEFWSALSSD